ncbi:MAG: bifunctional [glutamate--ammonia ligase]-adenylyl-L-tyrosine phosphorylase/[glutamate--ammonia-ligase] adenylyltransferase, partial [Gemmataceae bacterium]
GGDLPAVRQRNTLLALEALEIAGCLTAQETYCLADSYRFLRKTEHRLQLLFDLQTHRLPADVGEIRKLALRLGYEERRRTEPDQPANAETAPNLSAQRRSPLDEAVPDHRLNPRDLLIDPLDLFLQDLHDTTRLNRVILNHLLHQTFGDVDHPAESDPVADLILDPDPEEAAVEQVLSRYGFRDLPKAYNNLLLLAKESVPFLSHRRCRHFFASIAPQLLHVVSETPDPDESLNNLEKVTASLGAKAVLYELLSANQPSLKLYVELCSGSPFLSGILINNPGMIDELLDSLVLDQPRGLAEFQTELTELTRGANDLEPIYKSFQDKELLRIGVRDILKKGTIQSTTTELSALAEAILQSVVTIQEQDLCQRHAVMTLGEYCIVALGKLGGQEMSYHSDLDLILIYRHETLDGTMCPPETQYHFLTELMQKSIKMLTRSGPLGRLYSVDMRLRPTGKSGSLVIAQDEFDRYFESGGAQLWERQALCRARVVCGDPTFCTSVRASIERAILAPMPSGRIVA